MAYEIQERRNALEWQGAPANGERLPDFGSDSEYSFEEDIPSTGVHPSYLQKPAENAANGLLDGGDVPPKTKVELPASAQQFPSVATQGYAPRVRKTHHKDNPAEARWRKRLPPDGSCPIRLYLGKLINVYRIAITGREKKTYARSETAETSPFEPLRRIGRRTRTFIRIPSYKDRRLEIWAIHPTGLEAARRELAVLVRPPRTTQPRPAHNGTTRARPIPIVHPVSERANKDMIVKFEARTKLELYRQEPESADEFSFTGTFLWPSSEIHPDHLFGSSHARLDDLRIFHSVFITYDRRLSVFKILTNDVGGIGKVDEVLNKLRVAFCESVASRCAPVEIYLVRPPGPKEAKTFVRMVDSDLRLKAKVPHPNDSTPFPRSVLKSAEVAGADLTTDEKSRWNVTAARVTARNQKLIEGALLRTLKRAVYTRARLHMRAHFGLFVFNKYVSLDDNTKIPTVEFMENISDPKTKGSMQQVLLAKEEVNILFRAMWDATDLFDPIDSSSDTLKDVKPFHSAWFQFDYGRSEYLKLQIEACPIHGLHSCHEITRRQWSKHSRITAGPMQVYMIPLKKGITWKMQITADANVHEPDLATRLTKFSAAVQLLPPSPNVLDIGGTELIFDIPGQEHFPNINHYFQQKTSWRYRLHGNGAYVFEVARYDKFGPSRKHASREPSSTQWGFSLWCVGWDEKLSGNAALRIGEQAIWTPSLEEFFPEKHRSQSTGPHPGFTDYVKILERIVEVLGNAMRANVPEDNGNGVAADVQEEDLLI